MKNYEKLLKIGKCNEKKRNTNENLWQTLETYEIICKCNEKLMKIRQKPWNNYENLWKTNEKPRTTLKKFCRLWKGQCLLRHLSGLCLLNKKISDLRMMSKIVFWASARKCSSQVGWSYENAPLKLRVSSQASQNMSKISFKGDAKNIISGGWCNDGSWWHFVGRLKLRPS